MEPKTPSLAALPERLREVAVALGATLAERGRQAWVVGGAVRDIAMGRVISDVDLTTDATPAEVEGLFPDTVPLGKRFGTVLVKVSGLGVEVTTLRAEGDYTDARRPETIHFGTSVEEDALRRDFTCNAMYLDTQTGEFLDPVHGMKDLASGRLRAVGDASIRFSEDGLRIFRLARFAAVLGLKPEEETLLGAEASLDALRGVSAERILAEISRGLVGSRASIMLEVLVQLGVHQRLFPSASDRAGEDACVVMRYLPEAPEMVVSLLLFADPDPLGSCGDSRAERAPAVMAGIEALRPSKQLRQSAEKTWGLCSSLEAGSVAGVDKGQIRVWMREPEWQGATSLALGCALGMGLDAGRFGLWREEKDGLSEDELFPSPWVDGAQLRTLGLPPGPAWKEVISEALRMQLGGEWGSQSEALDWARSRLGS